MKKPLRNQNSRAWSTLQEPERIYESYEDALDILANSTRRRRYALLGKKRFVPGRQSSLVQLYYYNTMYNTRRQPAPEVHGDDQLLRANSWEEVQGGDRSPSLCLHIAQRPSRAKGVSQ